MADRRGVIIPLVFLLFIFLSPDPQQSPAARQALRQPLLSAILAEEQHSLDVLNSSRYGDFDPANHRRVNLTGLGEEAGFAWDALGSVKSRAREQGSHVLGAWGEKALDGVYGPGEPPPPLYKNVSGYVRGQWVRSKIQQDMEAPQLNLSAYAPEGPFGPTPIATFGRNLTGQQGSVDMRLTQKRLWLEGSYNGANVTEMVVEVTVQDEDTGADWEAKLRGVYFMDFGEAVLTTTSNKFAGIFALPQLALSPHTFDLSQHLLHATVQRVIDMQRDVMISPVHPWSSATEGAAETPWSIPNCELIVYLQQHPITGSLAQPLSSPVLAFLERELRFPTGAFVPPAPELHFSMLAFSPDCGYVLESKGQPDYVGQHLVGPKQEVHYAMGRHHILLFTLVLLSQLLLLVRQMREASTPSTRSRISFYTIAMLALGDGFTTMSFCLISLLVDALWVNLIATSFLSFLSVSFFGMRFLMDIWTVQAPERARREREELEEHRRRLAAANEALDRIRQRNAAQRAAAGDAATTANNEHSAAAETTDVAPPTVPSTPAAVPDAAAAPDVSQQPATALQPGIMLPLPVTAQRPVDTGATPITIPSDQDAAGEAGAAATTTGSSSGFGALYTKFYLLLLVALFMSLNAASWPAAARRVYFTLLALAYLSFWCPQISRNVQRNCRHALNWEFVAGQSVLRLMPFAYFYGYSGNVIFADVDLTSFALIAGWVWVQVVVLVSQEIIGPRWFVKSDWAPPAYDYHPVLREDEEGATMPIGFAEASTTTPTSPLERRGSSPLDRRSSASLARRPSLAKDKEVKDKGKRVFECAICQQDLEVPVVQSGASADAGSTLGGSLLARRMYMVTPCRHIFHSACLEGWMKYRLQCPNCRETLPPL